MNLSPQTEGPGPLEPAAYPTHAHNEVVDILNKLSIDSLSDCIEDPVVVPFKVSPALQKSLARTTGFLVVQEGGHTHSRITGAPLNPVDTPVNGHAFTHALSTIAEREFTSLRARAGTLEVGPSLTNLPQSHSDSLISGRTQSRYIKAISPSNQADILNNFAHHSSGAGACDVPADYVYANMVAHDLTYKDVYDIFAKHSAIRGRFALFLPTPLIMGANFTDEATGCSYEFDRIGNKIHMHMPDLSFSYTHDYDTWISWLNSPVHNGRDFSLSFEIVRNYGPVAIVEVYRCTSADVLIRRFTPYKRDTVRIPDIAALLPILRRSANMTPFSINTAAGLLSSIKNLKYYELPTDIITDVGSS